MPREFAGVDVDRDRGIGIQIVAGARLRIVLRNRIAGAPDGEPRCRIVRAGLPQSAAAGFPRLVFVFPRFAARFAGCGHGVPAPEFVASSRVERSDPATRFAVARAVGDDHLAVGGDGRREEPFLAAEFVGHQDLLVPHDLAVVAVDADDAAVRQIGDHEVFPQRDAARARNVALVRHAGVGDPHEFALVRIARVDLVDRAPAVGRVHEAVVDQRIDFVLRAVLADVLHAAQRHRPHDPQVFDVLPVDLGELRVARGAVVAVHHEPVLRLILRVEQPVPVDGHFVIGGRCLNGAAADDGERKRDGRACEVAHDGTSLEMMSRNDLVACRRAAATSAICHRQRALSKRISAAPEV